MARYVPQWARLTVKYANRFRRWISRTARHNKNRFVRSVWKEHVQKWIRYVYDSDYRFLKNSLHLGAYKNMPDEAFITRQYRAELGKELNLSDPGTFNEKLQWLKLYDRRPEYAVMADKYAVKKWVADRIGERYVTPALGVWDHFDEIDFNSLPDRFVLKCTHDSGSTIVVKDKNALDTKSALWVKENVKFDKKGIKRKLEACLRRNIYYRNREWAYKNVPPRIIAEEYMVDESGTQLKDYKIFNFNGEPKLIQVDYDRSARHKRKLYTTDWECMDVVLKYPTDPAQTFERPKQMEELLALARGLSAGIPFVRTDFYIVEDRIKFGEMTFYPKGGYAKFEPEEWDRTLGDWIKLPKASWNEGQSPML